MTRQALYASTAASAMIVSIAALSPSASGQPSDVVYQFQVLTESIRNCSDQLGADPNPADCPVIPGHAPYILGMLTITHQAFAKKRAIWLNGQDEPNEQHTDDQGIVSWISTAPTQSSVDASYMSTLRLPPPPTIVVPMSWELDLNISGGEISGEITLENFVGHGFGCSLSMTGTDGHWSGTWVCNPHLGPGVQHAFTAIGTREIGHVAQK
jgi:hypothetical protein